MIKQFLLICSFVLLVSVTYALESPVSKNRTTISYTDNFYQAVNSKWLATHKINPQQGSVSNFSILIDTTNQQLKTIIERLDKADKLTSDEQKVIDFYRSYVNTEYRNKLGIKPLLKQLKLIQSAKNYDDIAHLFAKLSIIMVSSPVSIHLSIDKKDSTKYIMNVGQGGLSLDKEIYQGTDKANLEKIKYYKEYLTAVLTLAQLDNISKKVDDILELETKVAKIQWDRSQLRESATIDKTGDFKQLTTLLSHLDMDEYLTIRGLKKEQSFISTNKLNREQLT